MQPLPPVAIPIHELHLLDQPGIIVCIAARNLGVIDGVVPNVQGVGHIAARYEETNSGSPKLWLSVPQMATRTLPPERR
jgi:hypothetical protein